MVNRRRRLPLHPTRNRHDEQLQRRCGSSIATVLFQARIAA
jgi:hypothetical protein